MEQDEFVQRASIAICAALMTRIGTPSQATGDRLEWCAQISVQHARDLWDELNRRDEIPGPMPPVRVGG